MLHSLVTPSIKFTHPTSNNAIKSELTLSKIVSNMPNIGKIPCSFQTKQHPNGEHVTQLCHENLQLMQFFNNNQEEARYLKMKLPDLTALTYPNGTISDSYHLANIIVWLYYMDDQLDSEEIVDQNTQRAKSVTERAHQLLKLEIQPETSYESLLMTSWKYIQEKMSHKIKNRYVRRNQEFLNACYLQNLQMETQLIPSLDQYFELRQDSSWVNAAFVLLEWNLGIELRDEILELPEMIALNKLASEHICLVDDLVSYEREQKYGEVYNLILILNKHHGMRIAEAIQEVYVAVICCDLLFRYIRNSLSVRYPLDNQLALYLDGDEAWMAGFLSWCQASSRYHLPDITSINDDNISSTINNNLLLPYISIPGFRFHSIINS